MLLLMTSMIAAVIADISISDTAKRR